MPYTYSVIEFAAEDGGGVSLIRREWLTPQKQRCMWPPAKKFNKYIDGSVVADTSTWQIFTIKRVFYETDNLAKAREKSKQAEIESEVNSDHDKSAARRRKKTRKIYNSSISDTSGDNSDDNNSMVYPKPPATKLVLDTKTHSKPPTGEIHKHRNTPVTYTDRECVKIRPTRASSTDEIINEKYQKQAASKVCSTPVTYADRESVKVHPTRASSTDEIINEKYQKQAASKVCSRPFTYTDRECVKEHPTRASSTDEIINEKYQKQAASKVCSRPFTYTDRECVKEHPTRASSTDDEISNEKYQKQVSSTPTSEEECVVEKPCKKVSATEICSSQGTSTNTEVSLQSLSCLDLTLSPFLKETPNSQALDVIAKHLARIESDIRDLQISQQEILIRVRSSSFTPLEHSLPDGITLPCDDKEALIKIETWIKTSNENGKLLITYLSLVGGNKIPVIIRRILEKIFTNKVAVLCNWTGKNNKTPLKDLNLIKIIRDAVRLNQIAANATDSEIHEVISNWFRFTKDRNGGREARRAKQ